MSMDEADDSDESDKLDDSQGRPVSDNLIVFDIKGDAARPVKEKITVYRGRFEKRKRVAAKQLQVAGLRRNKDGSINKDESIFLLKLAGHPNILKYYCTYVEPNFNFMYIVTELCAGTLEDLIDGAKYKEKQPVGNEREILVQITRAVAYLHERKIEHRDIKPGNIFFTKKYGNIVRPRMKLADFGSCCSLIKDGFENGLVNNETSPSRGTMGWMAPEFYESNTCGVKGDVFAFGLVFSYTLSIEGRHPFDKIKIGDPEEDHNQNDPYTRQDNINNQKMTLTNDNLKTPYHEGPVAFNLIESMVKGAPEHRPNLSEILINEFFLNVV